MDQNYAIVKVHVMGKWREKCNCTGGAGGGICGKLEVAQRLRDKFNGIYSESCDRHEWIIFKRLGKGEA